MIEFRVWFFAGLPALCLFSYDPAAAQVQAVVQAVDAGKASEHILVTGVHTPLAADKLGSSHTVITAEDIDRLQAVRVADVLRAVPGLAVSGNGSVGGQVNIRVRGAEANHLLVLIDGIKANDIAGDDGFDFAHLLTDNVERIEIIRGPQSALYGSEALAGVIQIITKSGGSATGVSGALEKGAFDSVHGAAGIAVGDSSLHYSLHAAYLDSDGDNVALAGGEDDGYKNQTAAFKMGVTAFENLRMEAVGRHTKSDTETDADNFVTGGAQDADQHSEVAQTYLGARADFDLLGGRWRHRAGVALTDTDNDHFSAGARDDSTRGGKLRFDYHSTFHFDTAAANTTLTVGVDHEKDRFTQVGQVTPFGDPNHRRRATTTGWVGGYEARVGEWLSLSASARRDEHSAFADANTYRLTAAYRIQAPNTWLRTSFGEGFKRPTFYERFGYYTNFIGNPDLQPEQSRAWDLGLRRRFLRDRAAFDAAYFRARSKNKIDGFVFTGAGFTAENLPGVSRREGVELVADAKVNDALTLALNYTWLNASDPNGKQEVRRPRHQVNANLYYRFPNHRAGFNFTVNYIGERSDNNFATGETAALGGDWLFNVAADYRLSARVRLYAKVDNLFDRNYSSIYGYNTPGTYAGIGIKAQFQP